MALSTTFSVPRGFLGVPAAQDSHFAPAAELHAHHKQLQARPVKPRRRSPACVSASLSEREREAEYYSQRPPTPLLDTVNYPVHMKNLSAKELRQLADELRSDVIFHVSKTGGHLGSSLGVVELTVALHYVFNAPQDRILWDVGHQSYPHKILTGRREKMPTMRQTNGLAGFTKRSESEYDSFGTGHSSTTISAALGMAVGRDLKGGKNHVVAVIGDGAMTAGQAYEAMNNAGYLDSDMIVILNDNKQVSLPTATLDGPVPPVGALSSALSKLQSSRPLRELREVAKGVTKQIGGSVHELAAKVDEYARGMISGPGSSLFEELGLYYIGPVDGHSIDDLISILNDVKSTKTTGPVLIHVITEKGRGYPYAERAADKYHGESRRQVRPCDGEAVQVPSQDALLHQLLRRVPHRGGRAGQQDRRHPRGDGGRHGAQLLPPPLPEPVLRRRDRGAARGDVRGGARLRGPQALLRHLLLLPAARVRPGGARRGPPEAPRAVRHGPGRARGRRRAHALRRVRRDIHGVPPQHGRHGARRRGRALPHGRHRRRHRRPPELLQVPEGQRHRGAAAAGVQGHAARGRQGEDPDGGRTGRAAGVRVGRAVLPRRGGTRGAPRLIEGHRRRRQVLQAARPRAHQEPRQVARGAHHRRGRIHRRVRLPRRPVHGARRPPRRQTQVAPAGAPGQVHRPRIAGGSAGGGRAHAVAHRSHGVQRPGAEQGGTCHHGGAERVGRLGVIDSSSLERCLYVDFILSLDVNREISLLNLDENVAGTSEL